MTRVRDSNERKGKYCRLYTVACMISRLYDNRVLSIPVQKPCLGDINNMWLFLSVVVLIQYCRKSISFEVVYIESKWRK